MGQVLTIPTSQILPSQDFLKEDTIKMILTSFFENRPDRLPPLPIIRHLPDSDLYLAIDGHNRIAIDDLFGDDSNVYVAEGPEDAISLKESPNSTPEKIATRNLELKNLFDQIHPVATFSILRQKYSYLVDLKHAKEYYSQHRQEFIKIYLPSKS